jgi:hypothetical protein
MVSIVDQEKSSEILDVPFPVIIELVSTSSSPSETKSEDPHSSTTTAEFKKAERRLKWKLDAVILPLTTLLYLAAYLD